MCPRHYVVNGVPQWTFWQKWADGDALGYEYGMRSGDVDLSWYNGTPETFKREFGVELPDNEAADDFLLNCTELGIEHKAKPRKYFKRDKMNWR